WLPRSSSSVRQHPSRWKPVSGSVPHGWSSSPSTLRSLIGPPWHGTGREHTPLGGKARCGGGCPRSVAVGHERALGLERLHQSAFAQDARRLAHGVECDAVLVGECAFPRHAPSRRPLAAVDQSGEVFGQEFVLVARLVVRVVLAWCGTAHVSTLERS